ncbi:MAG: GYD domain-containing protein [Thermoleophilia bacterium]|nr:GYD domain-containing protein [Gaiellaceae bacterium]MDW8339730.1 GYD domain-containing protein [Thermoleophilia bacterium]
MPTYVSLVHWTDKGIAAFADTVDRAEAAKELATKFGGSLKEVYWTLGPYDIVTVSEAPDDETATAFALALGAQGNVRTTTMRAFSADEMRAIIAKTA